MLVSYTTVSTCLLCPSSCFCLWVEVHSCCRAACSLGGEHTASLRDMWFTFTFKLILRHQSGPLLVQLSTLPSCHAISLISFQCGWTPMVRAFMVRWLQCWAFCKYPVPADVRWHQQATWKAPGFPVRYLVALTFSVPAGSDVGRQRHKYWWDGINTHTLRLCWAYLCPSF